MSSNSAPPRPPAPARNASAASPTVVVTAIRRPGHDLRQRERQLDAPQQLARRQAHAAAGVARLLGHVVEAGHDVAEQDQQRVGDERDDRRGVPAAGDRQQQEEDRDARQRVEDPRHLRDRRRQPAPAVGEQREGERDREADADRHQRQVDVLPERVDVAVEVVGDPVRADPVVGHAVLAAAVALLELGEGRRHAVLRRRGDHVREQLDREHADDAALRVDDRPVLDLVGQQVAQRVAQDVVELDDRLGRRRELGAHALLAQPALGEPPERPPVAVDHERVRHLGGRRAGARLGHRLALADERRRPQVDVAHALEREPLERAVGAHEVLHERVRGAHQQLRGRRVLGEDAALLQHRDAVAHLDRLVDVVGDEDDRLADLGLEAQELVLEPLAVDRVDRAERLVHQHQRRVGGERAGDADALALAAGELRRVAAGHLLRQADQVEQLLARARRCAACPSRAAAARWRCSRRSSGGGTGRSAGSRSRCRAAARPRRARARCGRRRGCRPR